MLWGTAQRPWPLPSGPWMMKQRWHEVLFAHWSFSADALQRLDRIDDAITALRKEKADVVRELTKPRKRGRGGGYVNRGARMFPAAGRRRHRLC